MSKRPTYTIEDFEEFLPAEPETDTHGKGETSRRRGVLPSSPNRADVLKRARAYMDTVEPAVEGQHGDQHTFTKVCRIVRGFDLSDDEALEVLDLWNQRCQPSWPHRDLLSKIQGARRYGSEPLGGLLDGDSARISRRREISNISAPIRQSTEEPRAGVKIPDLLTQGNHDTGNADRIKLLHGRNLRYCTEFRKYIHYDGKKWSPDVNGKARKLAKETMITFLQQSFDKDDSKAEAFARSSLNANRINAALELLQCEVPIQATDLDPDPWLLNVENGTLNLRSFELQQHDPTDYITKIVPFFYDPNAKCERFLAFLHQIMGAAEDSGLGELERAERLVRYLQKIFGYAITGAVSEKSVFCFFGPTDAGKTTLLETIRYPIAEYSHQILIDSLMVRHSHESNNSLADLADLRGARFVTTSEGEDGQRLAEAKVKYLSAGMGEIKTCRKYENPITFQASHKLFLDSNYKPVVKGSDDAIWNRLKPIPFTVTIPKERIDRTLGEKLRAEAAGILAWMVEGCRLWKQEGLDQPEEVQAANKEWRDEMDPLPEFLEDCCEIAPTETVQVSTFRKAYEAWADENSDKFFLKRGEFTKRLEQRGFERKQRRHLKKQQRTWIGLTLKEITG